MTKNNDVEINFEDEEVDMRAPPDYEEFVVDRPFVFFIMDSGTSTVLFCREND